MMYMMVKALIFLSFTFGFSQAFAAPDCSQRLSDLDKQMQKLEQACPQHQRDAVNVVQRSQEIMVEVTTLACDGSKDKSDEDAGKESKSELMGRIELLQRSLARTSRLPASKNIANLKNCGRVNIHTQVAQDEIIERDR